MNEIYEFEGQTYDVNPNKLEAFLSQFPEATKVDTPGKTTDPAVAEPIVGSENTVSTGEESSMESQDDGSWKTDENLTPEEIKVRDKDFFDAWSEVNPGNEITKETLVKEKNKEEIKKKADPTPDVDTSNSLLAPYLKNEEELIAQPSSTFIPQQEVVDGEEDKKRMELNEVSKKASNNFENYKKKNPDLFKPIYTDQGATTVADYGDSKGVDKMNQDLTFEYIRNNKEIQG